MLWAELTLIKVSWQLAGMCAGDRCAIVAISRVPSIRLLLII